MQIVINIPKEFEGDWNDTRFADCIHRAMIDLADYPEHNKMTGNYEMETLEMLRDAFENGKVLPKEHGELKDVDQIKKEAVDMGHDFFNPCYGVWVEDIDEAETIIPADKESK